MEAKKIGNKQIIFGVIALVAVIALFIGAYAMFAPKVAEGAKAISIEVIDKEQKSTVYELNTDAEYLRQAMEEAAEQGLTFSGAEDQYGMMLDTVNGVRADYTLDGAYWSVMVNGEYGMYGIDTQVVADGDAYQLVYTPATY